MLDTIINVLREGWGWMFLRGASMTLLISVLGMFLGVVIGISGASLKISAPAPVKALVTAYTTIVRSIPELLIIYLLFFGTTRLAIDISDWFDQPDFMDHGFPLSVGILAIGLISGSYSVEVFRGALLAIPAGQIEAARAIGMTGWQRLRRIILPQMFWYALPGANNVWQNALKDTALISLVGLVEIMRAAVLGAAKTREPMAMYLIAGALFFLIGVLSQGLFVVAERYYGRGMRAKS
ncbi:ABC transporter permease [Alcaligenes endophyticus]|uniref:ABC transporter permease subunit n=1 Tax=Alcaligenes endophyticus TaxID=1929088 RepID=A0ABT8EEI7_9BURK|nr:ABC transporter permease subunit [Alcaligenes endophyticus]MCX5592254.1 ABC transporter permease subunit [Alcaligenes endophyticus]MDN4119696.1 ABC transporter permease subunit [Alcaligenes endophyticus]